MGVGNKSQNSEATFVETHQRRRTGETGRNDKQHDLSLVREYRDNGEEGLKPKRRKGDPYSALHTGNSLTEIERLRLLVAKKEIEIERLKRCWADGVVANEVYDTGNVRLTKLTKE